MKRILIIISLFALSKTGFAQADTIVTNLQLKGGTIKVISALVIKTGNADALKAFFKWRQQYADGNPPNDNANVTIDTAKTVSVAFAYRLLLSMEGGYTEVVNYIIDFKTSITAKRGTNAMLDALCGAIELEYTNGFNAIMESGRKYLEEN